MSKATLVRLTAWMLCVLATSACIVGGDGRTTVTMWTFLDPEASSGRGKVLGDLISSFEAEHAGVRIEVQRKPWERLTQSFLAASVAGDAPDITWTVVDNYADVVSQDALVELPGLAFDADDVADLRTPFWEAMTVDGSGPYGVVMSQNCFGIYYRKDLLAKAGLDESALTTWDGFLRAARAMNDPANGVHGYGQQFATTQADPQIMVPWLLDHQGSLFDEHGAPRWSTETGVQALDFQAGMVTSGITPRDSVRWTAEDIYEQFAAGRLAMANGASTRIPDMQKSLGEDEVGFARYPSEDGSVPPQQLNGWSVGVWSGSEVKEQAASFVAHLASPEADRAWVEEAGQLPARLSTAQAIPDGHHLGELTRRVQEHGWLPPLGVPTSNWQLDMNEATQSVLLGDVPSREALGTAEDKFTERHRRR